MAPETELSKARLALLQKFNWTIVTMLQASAQLFTATGEVMRSLIQENNMTVNSTLPFDTDPEGTIDLLKRSDARIIYFNSYEDQARNACCVAYQKKFFGKKIVWIFPGFYDLKWFDHNDTDCTPKQILEQRQHGRRPAGATRR
ncbi:gamma-aminobutyric acid type B receptor subunit 1-like [Babylonia areolata]|uniref:gamma-aminobutyric acid type B receptor subunit 1-like n=1 Tax=Babylonia areolata TaxID=304850 RepID=UPI003FD3AB52